MYVCVMGVGVVAWGVKKYIAAGSEAAGSRTLWDGGMFSVQQSQPPLNMQIHTRGYKQEQIRKCTLL